jgi:hypothetical protein
MAGLAAMQVQNDSYPLSIYEPSAGVNVVWSTGNAQVADGTKGADFSSSGVPTFTFITPVSDFGGFWGADGGEAVGLDFFDAAGNRLGGTSIYFESAGIAWHGWHSDVGIAKIEINGFTMVADGLQAIPIPEPHGPAVFAVLAALMLARVATQRHSKKLE